MSQCDSPVRALVGAVCVCVFGSVASAQDDFQITPGIQQVLDRISAESMEKHLTYLASDELAGRDTPSPGLELAAVYIAEQFKKAGLEPAGDDGYFQIANWTVTTHDAEMFSMRLDAGRPIELTVDDVTIDHMGTIRVDDGPLIVVAFDDARTLSALEPAHVQGGAILTNLPASRRGMGRGANSQRDAIQAFNAHMERLSPAAILVVDESPVAGGFRQQLNNPDSPPRFGRRDSATPTIRVHNPRVQTLFETKDVEARLTINLGEAIDKPVKLKNVIGVLRGSDPELRDEYVMVTAHYDHVGVRPGSGDDPIYNGANDDGSGTVSVVELASALGSMEQRPRRSVIFMTFFGEEKGLLGSRYYGRNPVFPLVKTVADVNLEQVGRTDADNGPQVRTASMTGIDYSEVGAIFQRAGKVTGIDVYKHEPYSDAFFGRSDNQAMADQGVPAHTICVAYQYPDYHQPGDHADLVDYENMAAVNRMIALGILMIAHRDEPPRWDADNPRATKYLSAWRALQDQ